MTLRARLLSLATAGALCFAAASAHAYCVTRTCDGNDPKQNCEIVGICVMSGLPLYWSHGCVSFDVQKDGSAKDGISYEELHQIVRDAAATWTGVDCGGGAKPSIVINDFGPVNCNHPEYNKTEPNANVIMFHDAKPWPYAANGADTLALTTVTFDTTSGEIFDADIEINTADDRNMFSLDPTTGSGTNPDLPGVLTHELGHFLGLSHADNTAATMFQQYEQGMATLDPDDIAGICDAMSNPKRSAGNDCTPRHGFSVDCATGEHGCCSTAVGANASRGQALGLLAFALGLGGWRARRRLTSSQRAPRR